MTRTLFGAYTKSGGSYPGYINVSRAGEQADMDGTLVKVSRQACEEAADAIEALQAQLAEARDMKGERG